MENLFAQGALLVSGTQCRLRSFRVGLEETQSVLQTTARKLESSRALIMRSDQFLHNQAPASSKTSSF